MGGAKPAAGGVSSDERKSERRRPPSPKEAPWLVFPYQVKGNKQNQAFYNICEPNNRTLRKFILELSGKSYWQKQSHKGWLVVICDDRNYNYAPNWDFGDCFLWNPASLETIQLPSLLQWYSTYEYELLDCGLSITYPDNGNDDPMVLMPLLLYEGHYDKFLVYCRPEDKQWTTKRVWPKDAADVIDVSSVCCLKDKLYLMSLDDKHLEIDKGNLWDDDHNESLTGVRPFETTNKTGFPWRDNQNHIDYTCFHVESSDELFDVHIHFNAKQNMKVFNSVVVLRLDLSSMEWKVVTCLGDHVLFISENTRFCCSASKLGLPSGCVYYTFEEDQGLYKFEVQSSRNSVILPCLNLPKPWFSSGWIMILNGKQQMDEEDCIGNAVESNTSIIAYENNEFGGFHETSTPWDILNADSKELVASYLHPLDYVQLRSVCKRIRAVMPVSKPTLATTNVTETSYLFPWMVFCRDKNDTIYNFVIPVRNNENYLIKFSELLLGATVRFQKGGWLLMSREEIVFFYNPFTRETINLPQLPEHNLPTGVDGHLPKHYFSSSICFSSLPTSADCMVFAVDQSVLSNPRTINVYYISRGKQDWDIFNFDNAIQYMPLCNSPIFHQGFFYCVDYNGLLGTFSLEDNTWKVHGTPREIYNDTYRYPSFMVKSGDDILLVKLGCEAKLVRIYKLNFPAMNWVEVKSLGKCMLFVSHTSCISANAPNSEMENKVYFPRLCLNGEGILFYSLETGRYDSFGGQHSSKNLYDTEGWLENCTWIEPSWTKFTPQELNWFETPL